MFSDGNAVEHFRCGRDAYPQMLAAIEGAREHVLLESYVLRADRAGSRFLEALADRAASGLHVRLLYDAIGSHELADAALDPLRKAGAHTLCFRPLRKFLGRWIPRRRDHRKLLIVDGREAFTGGLNIGDEYDAGPEAGPEGDGWRDTQLRVRGPAVRALAEVFLDSWAATDGPDVDGLELAAAPGPGPGDERCAVLPDGPSDRRRMMRDLLVSSLDASRVSARLTSPYFAPDRRVFEALKRSAERGVRVELMLAGQTDHPFLRRSARATLERLLDRGVEVHEYTAAMLHAKTAVFDGRDAIVGTSNLDRQSLLHNFEVNLVASGGALPGEVAAAFEADLTRSEELTLDGLAHRDLWTRAVDRAAAAIVRRLL